MSSSIFSGPTQKFYKMQGSGNDFIVIDNRDRAISPAVMPAWAKALCPHAFRIGADGLIFLEKDDSGQAATRWHFFNADGSRAEMCGNGARCATLLAHCLGMAEAEHHMLTDAGPIHALVDAAKGEVEVQLPPVQDIRMNLTLDVDGESRSIHVANTGVPHAVMIRDDLDSLDVRSLGSHIRHHPMFSPNGVNANFIRILDQETFRLRTYERGVENETYACGTGAAASVIVARTLGLCAPTVQVTTSGGEVLRISLRDGTVFLRGAAQIVYQGVFSLKALGLS